MKHLRSSDILIPLLIAALTVASWWLFNRPSDVPPWPNKITGFAFSPLRDGDNQALKRFPKLENIDKDLALIESKAYAIRTYTVEDSLGEVPRLAEKYDINITLGAWISSDPIANEKELTKLDSILQENHRNVVRVMVGNEVILRGDISVDKLAHILDRVRKTANRPVSTAEPWHVWLDHPELADHVDFITVHLLPYWEGVPVKQSVDYVFQRYNEVAQRFPHKPIIIGEVGWPSNGRIIHGAEPSLANENWFLRQFISRAMAKDYVFYIMEAFDQRWKRDIEGEAGSYWGVYDENRQPKFDFTAPVIRIPDWRELSGISIIFAILILTLVYRDSSSMSNWGKSFLALITYAIATAAVYIVYSYSSRYMSPLTILVGIMLMLGGLGVLVLLVAEAHEWAESLFLKRWRRAFPQNSHSDYHPMVSIHVPAYNEPPELLKKTLDGLAALDYPNYEVLVIDNNTKDPEIWKPIEAYCAELGADRFRFFHVAPLAGYKAGALNFALRHTNPEAKVVAVIDADYIVIPNWLRDLIPAFADQEIAIVQAPQDYRDANENAFKSMCMAEYRGFFNLGMVTRNERNAIIQHGTMTMIRRRDLEEVDGWSEWCITEDAELGLKIFEHGYKALYIPYTYGQGLMPDNFADFKKQRYRWAYGSARILHAHWRALIGRTKTKLTTGQRYHFLAGWLPWLADSCNLMFNFLALIWTVGMVFLPQYFSPPYISIALVPVIVFSFKMIKSFVLYRTRVQANWRQCIGSALAGLALSHTIARAMIAGLFSGKLGFFRTPKLAKAPAVVKSLVDCWQEILLAILMIGGALATYYLRVDSDMLDIKIWTWVLLIQSIPYVATIIVAIISSFDKLPAKIIGSMPDIHMSKDIWQQHSEEKTA